MSVNNIEFLTPSIYFNHLLAARDYIHQAIVQHLNQSNNQSNNQYNVVAAVVLGSGLGAFATTLTDQLIIEYHDIPHMPTPSVSGHAGQLIIGRLNYQSTNQSANQPNNQTIPNFVLCLSGRVHAYEHQSINQSILTFGVKTCCLLGARSIMLTNSAGGTMIDQSINQLNNQSNNQTNQEKMNEGDIVITSDHVRMADYPDEIDQSINQSTNQSLVFHSKELLDLSIKSATEIGVPFHVGVYCMSPGPSYETPGEVESLRRALGIRAFGMSTVPEIRAVYQSMQSINQSTNQLSNRSINVPVLCMSLCTNLAAGQSAGQILSHADVKAVADAAGHRLVHLLQQVTYQLINPSIQQTTNQSTNFSGLSDLAIAREAAMFKYFNQSNSQSNNQSINQSLPLSMPGASTDWKPSSASINQSINLLIETNNNQAPELCIFDPHQSIDQSIKQSINQSTDQLIEQGSIRTIRLIELPVFQSINQSINQPNQTSFSASVHSATIAFITVIQSTNQSNNQSNNQSIKRICLINQSTVNSFTPSETNCLIDCLIAIGVKYLTVLDCARSINQSNNQSSDHVVVANDLLDMSWTTLDPSINQSNNQAIKVFDQSFNQSIAQSLAQSNNKSIDQSSAFFFRSYPTEIELSFARVANQSNTQSINQSINQSVVCSLTNPNILLTARLKGLTVGLICFVNQSINQSINQSNNQSMLTDHKSVIVALSQSYPSIQQSINQSIKQTINQSTDRTINQSYTYDQVAEQAHEIEQWLSNNRSINQSNRPQSALVLEHGFITHLRINQSINQSIKLDLIQSNQEWQLELVTIKEQVMYAISPRLDHSSALRTNQSNNQSYHVFDGLRALPRVLKMLGVKHMLAICPFKLINQSNNQSNNQTDWCGIIESINLSGVNPLRGPNDDRFGFRFPDSSSLYDVDSLIDCYNQSLTQAINQSNNQSISQSIAIITRHCIFDSDVENQLHSKLVDYAVKPSINQSIDLSVNQSIKPSAVRSAGLLDLIIPANHSGLKVACIGYTGQSINQSNNQSNMMTVIEKWSTRVNARK